MSNNIKVIIVTYNSSEDIINCLQALKNVSKKFKLSIRIVDNASSDDTLEKVDQFSKDIEIIRMTENLGYAYGNNIGIKLTASENITYKYVLLLNPDVVCNIGCIDRLAKILECNMEVGMVSPKVIESARQTSKISSFRSLWGLPFKPVLLGSEYIMQVDRLHGCCLLIKANLLDIVGLFDESYFLYWEEIDFCLRVKSAGYKMFLINTIEVSHRLGGAERSHRIYYMYRNQFYFALKNFGVVIGFIFLTRRFLTIVREFINFIILKRWDLIAAGIAGLVAGIKGEKGRSSNPYARPTSGSLRPSSSGKQAMKQ